MRDLYLKVQHVGHVPLMNTKLGCVGCFNFYIYYMKAEGDAYLKHFLLPFIYFKADTFLYSETCCAINIKISK
jgi:hypothetical protein